ncbi:MAG: hypothetical protein KIS87_13285 [Phycisphaeraceae bacterium]|nr:hypothetical protein [Phycisphaeraceae bacterium]
MLTLWDLIAPRRKRRPPQPRPAPAARPVRRTPTAGPSMQDRYDAMTRQMLDRYGVRVRRWRKDMTGLAWEVYYANGETRRLIESPRPRGPVSAAIFLHEIGHHAIGFHRYKPRCLEEYHAWAFSLAQMEALGLNVTDRVRHRVHDSLHYAVMKARRRGLRSLPPELLPYAEPRRKTPRGPATSGAAPRRGTAPRRSRSRQAAR